LPIFDAFFYLDHLTLGILCGIVASRLGDNSLFPDKIGDSKNDNQKLPLNGVK
jgi:hypothetical protein